MMNISQFRENITAWITSATGKNILIYLIFVVVSSLFWLLMSLNDEVQKEMAIPLKIEGLPENVTLLRNSPIVLDVTVQSKGSSLIKYDFGKEANILFTYSEIKETGNRLKITNQQLQSALHSIFGQGQLVTFKPDSIIVPFTTLPPHKVPVEIDYKNISTQPQFVISNIIVSPDSVNLFSQENLSDKVSYISTEKISIKNLSDTTALQAKIITPSGIISEIETVDVKICVVPLITGHKNVAICPINLPNGRKLVLFPSSVDVSYLIPLDYYKTDKVQLDICADYENRNILTSKIPLSIVSNSSVIKNITLSADSVEYLIE